MTDLTDAYENSAYISNAKDYPDRWNRLASSFRDSTRTVEQDISYGSDPREKYDLFHPETASNGVLVFVHGGYWKAFDKSSWSHLAQGACANGWTVAVPSYVLAPKARISEITRQIAAMIGHVHQQQGGRIRLAGHSAGGHLVARMVCEGGPLAKPVSNQIDNVLSISGLHDLRPLLHTEMNQILGLTNAEAASESACLHMPLSGTKFTAWAGADERPEFIRQSQLLADVWGRAGAKTRCVLDPGQHHFSVISGLSDPQSAIIECLLG